MRQILGYAETRRRASATNPFALVEAPGLTAMFTCKEKQFVDLMVITGRPTMPMLPAGNLDFRMVKQPIVQSK